MRDRFLFVIAAGAGLLASGVTVLVFGFLALEALPLLVDVGPLAFLGSVWSPRDGEYGLLAMMAGSALVVTGAVLVTTPLGIAVALFASLYAPRWLAAVLRATLAVMGGIPSVVYGLWGLTVLVPRLNEWRPPGLSVLAGIVVLALMILPTMALLADGAVRAVPARLFQSAAALGLGRWAMARAVVLPSARAGLFAASMLQVGRAVGETMAILMVMGNTIQYPSSLSEPARALTAHIALEMGYALQDHRRALFVSGLFLLTIVAALVTVAHQRLSPRGELA